MNTLTAVWNELARIAELPLGWVLPIGALFLFFLGLWKLANHFAEPHEVRVYRPQPVVDERYRDLAITPIMPARSFSQPAAKGARAALASDHAGTVVNLEERKRAVSR